MFPLHKCLLSKELPNTIVLLLGSTLNLKLGSTQQSVRPDMCISGSPGSTVAGRDGEDGTNNNRGSASCGRNQNIDPSNGDKGGPGESACCILLSCFRGTSALVSAVSIQVNTCLQPAMLPWWGNSMCYEPKGYCPMPSLLFMYVYASAGVSISESVLQAMSIWDNGALGAVAC